MLARWMPPSSAAGRRLTTTAAGAPSPEAVTSGISATRSARGAGTGTGASAEVWSISGSVNSAASPTSALMLCKTSVMSATAGMGATGDASTWITSFPSPASFPLQPSFARRHDADAASPAAAAAARPAATGLRGESNPAMTPSARPRPILAPVSRLAVAGFSVDEVFNSWRVEP